MLDKADDSSQTMETKEPFYEKKSSYEAKGYVDFHNRLAKPKYKRGAIIYGPIELKLYIEKFRIILDWHRMLGIKKRYCVTLIRACGRKVTICQNINLGVSKIDLMKRITISNDISPIIHDLSFRKKGNQFELFADVGIFNLLKDVLITGWIKGAKRNIKRAIRKELKHILGNGFFARAVINLLLASLDIIDGVLNLILGFITAIVTIIDEALHLAIGDSLEISTGVKIDNNFQIMPTEGNHDAVYIKLKNPPEIDVVSKGFKIRIME
ncbi:hypothetical protein AADZ86_00880 [Colwelliaceae bacterium BS250]